ncbi:hypothetical protein NE235_29810 [Actinoallomurus spadix]|uniref:Uncharacterized protein n=1 Tax=Actinoallomurus spadix TaxID=79912 RepID=A0ABP3G1G2_9ACTN|nr:hypothetical protein [Actinoallomurus spadix]MCO5990317.1 hypothetical protein [Actinoallomurus spadix]
MEQRIRIDADGRHTSGRGFRTLAEEYQEFVGRLEQEWGEESPLPYLAFSEPYSRLRRSLLERCEQLGTALRDTGDGQTIMAETNVATEHLLATLAERAGQVEA